MNLRAIKFLVLKPVQFRYIIRLRSIVVWPLATIIRHTDNSMQSNTQRALKIHVRPIQIVKILFLKPQKRIEMKCSC